MASDQELYNQLSHYTLAHKSRSFPHQHIVDAYAAQHFDAKAKPIRIVFALVGLYLCAEKNYSGKQVQQAHMRLARLRKQWPALTPPAAFGAITVADALAAAPGAERDETIRRWCVEVWAAWKDCQEPIRRLVKEELDIG